MEADGGAEEEREQRWASSAICSIGAEASHAQTAVAIRCLSYPQLVVNDSNYVLDADDDVDPALWTWERAPPSDSPPSSPWGEVTTPPRASRCMVCCVRACVRVCVRVRVRASGRRARAAMEGARRA